MARPHGTSEDGAALYDTGHLNELTFSCCPKEPLIEANQTEHWRSQWHASTVPPSRGETNNMQVFGLESIRSELESDGYVVKLVAHDQAVAFMPRTAEHRETKIQGLSYEDDSQGNALAAMMSPGRIEFRHHRGFSDERVKRLALAILHHPDLGFAEHFQVSYQGRVLIAGK